MRTLPLQRDVCVTNLLAYDTAPSRLAWREARPPRRMARDEIDAELRERMTEADDPEKAMMMFLKEHCGLEGEDMKEAERMLAAVGRKRNEGAQDAQYRRLGMAADARRQSAAATELTERFPDLARIRRA